MQDLPYHRHPAERDQAVERVRRTTRWLVAASLLGTGVLIGVAAHELPGKGASAATAPNGSSGSTGSTGSSGLGATGSGGSLSEPGSAPQVHASTGAS